MSVREMMSADWGRIEFDKFYRKKVVRYQRRNLMDNCLKRFPVK